MKLDPDHPWVDSPPERAFGVRCPKCEAAPQDECTSLVTGCCPDGCHAERVQAATN